MHSTIIDLGPNKIDPSLLKTALNYSKSVSCNLFNSSGNLAVGSDSVKFIIADSASYSSLSYASVLACLDRKGFTSERIYQMKSHP